MSKMVTARVPDAVYETACDKLSAIGSNPSELINAAFEFMLANDKLPGKRAEAAQGRSLREDQQAKLERLFADCTLGITPVDDIRDDKRLAREARVAKYEALA